MARSAGATGRIAPGRRLIGSHIRCRTLAVAGACRAAAVRGARCHTDTDRSGIRGAGSRSPIKYQLNSAVRVGRRAFARAIVAGTAPEIIRVGVFVVASGARVRIHRVMAASRD